MGDLVIFWFRAYFRVMVKCRVMSMHESILYYACWIFASLSTETIYPKQKPRKSLYVQVRAIILLFSGQGWNGVYVLAWKLLVLFFSVWGLCPATQCISRPNIQIMFMDLAQLSSYIWDKAVQSLKYFTHLVSVQGLDAWITSVYRDEEYKLVNYLNRSNKQL